MPARSTNHPIDAATAARFAAKVQQLVPLWNHVRTLHDETPRWREALPRSPRFIALSAHCSEVPADLLDRLADENAAETRTATALAIQHAIRELRLQSKLGHLSPRELATIYRNAKDLPGTKPKEPRPAIRLCLYSAHGSGDIAHNPRVTALTSEKTRAGDVQLFAIGQPLAVIPGLAPYVDAIHSIWRAVSDASSEDGVTWSAHFERVLILDTPVFRADLNTSDVMRGWPQHPRGLLYSSKPEAARLADALARRNVSQQNEIRAALFITP